MINAWILTSAIILLVTLFAIWGRRPSWWRSISISVVLPAVILGVVAVLMAGGNPVPVVKGWTIPVQDHYTVLGYKLVPHVAIYVLVDGDPPVYVSLPWSDGAAQELQDAGEKGRRVGQKPTMRVRGSGGLFDFFDQKPNPKFYDPPQQAREPKPANPTSGLDVPIH